MLLQSPSRRGIFTSQTIGFFEFMAYSRRLLVYLHLIPALLQEVSLVVIPSVGIAEGNMFQFIIGFIETILNHSRKSRMTASKHIHKHRLSRTVTAYDSNMLTFFE